MKSGDVSRRFVVGALGASTVASVVATGRQAKARSSTEGAPGSEARLEAEPLMDPEAQAVAEALVAPLASGQQLGRWKLERAVPIKGGAAIFVLLGPDGGEFQLDVCARDDANEVPARTEYFDIHVANGGDGATATNEEHGLAAMALAEVIRSNEQRVDRARFETLVQRMARGDVRRHTTP